MTVACRVCSWCNGFMGVVLWPWSGKLFTVTHGQCDACFARVALEVELQEAGKTAEAA